MTDEPRKEAKTTAEGAAGGAAAPAGKTPPQEDAARGADEAAGKDEKQEKKAKKKDKDAKPEAGPAKAPAKPFKVPEVAILAAVVVVALAAGALLGTLVLAPRVIAARDARPAAKPHAEAPEAEASGHEAPAGEHGKKGAHGGGATVYSVDNIIVNPAGSAGTRFLMASVAFELPDEKAAEELRAKEVMIRDAVITTLESQTLEMLAVPGARDGIKRQIAATVKPLVPGQRTLRVYLPQFVLQ